MAYNTLNVGFNKYAVYFHRPTNSLIAVGKEESRKFVLESGPLNGTFFD